METTVQEKKEVRYISVDVAVRYEEEDMPYDAPMREGDVWKVFIDLEEHRILNWPVGKSLSFHDMKICDEGIYVLLDSKMEHVKTKEGYVPNNLLPGDYGDYLSLDIDENGVIKNWLPHANLSDFEAQE